MNDVISCITCPTNHTPAPNPYPTSTSHLPPTAMSTIHHQHLGFQVFADGFVEIAHRLDDAEVTGATQWVQHSGRYKSMIKHETKG